MSHRMFVLSTDEARRRAADYAIEGAPEDSIVKFGPSEKTRAQENLAHSCYQDFAACARIDGVPVTTEDWKKRLKVDFFDETGNDPEFMDDWKNCRPTITPIPGTRYMVMSEIHSSDFPRRLYRAYITFIHARGDELGVRWSKTSIGRESVAA